MTNAGRATPAPKIGSSSFWIGFAAVIFVALSVSIMLAAHELHYTQRRKRIKAARDRSLSEGTLEGLDTRIATVESILMEDRTI